MTDKGISQGQMHLMDEHGNRVDQIDESNATQGMAMGFAPPGTGTDAMKKDHQDEGQQQLCRSSSSSSEDDGEGGRRKKKKGIKEKIKETLSGGGGGGGDGDGGADQGVPTTPAPTPTGEAQKGMMEKIKEKIPGMH